MIELAAGGRKESWNSRRLWSLWDMFTRLLLVRFSNQMKFLYDTESDVDTRLIAVEDNRSGGGILGSTAESNLITKDDKTDAVKLLTDFREHATKF